MQASNPVAAELVKLEEQWESFIDSEQPILRWLIPPDGRQLANAFVKVKEQFEDDNPDLFISLTVPFTEPRRYATALAEEMNRLIEEGLAEARADEDAGEASNALDWQKPALDRFKNSFQALMESARATIDAFGEYFEYLTLAVMPPQIDDPEGYVQWWTACCRVYREYELWPDKLRLVVFDNTREPRLDAAVEACPDEMHSLSAPLDMRGAVDAVVNNADDGSPGAKLRRLMVDLNYAVGEQQRANMENVSQRALELAGAQQWTDMLATICLIRGAGYLNMELFEQALADYRLAQTHAEQGEQESKPGCDKLRLQALMCEGTTLFSAGQLEPAAAAYRKAAELAAIQDDQLMTLEGWRMESFCFERLKRTRQAWDSANRALQAGYAMDEQARAQSTLAFLGQALLRVAPDGRHSRQAEQAMQELLGPDWNKTSPESAAAC